MKIGLQKPTQYGVFLLSAILFAAYLMTVMYVGSFGLKPPSLKNTPSKASAATQAANCFVSPGNCGYPDPAVGNVGVPSGTNLTPSGSIAINTAGTVINAIAVTGVIEINADNVTIQNSRITQIGGGCGTQNSCGNSNIHILGPYTVNISHVELTTDAGTTVEHGIRNSYDGRINVDHVYQHGNIDALCWCGNGTIKDSYSIIHLAIANDHLENTYSDGHTLTLDHNTFFNLEGQTANIFANTNNGGGGVCRNHLTVTNNFMSGGGYSIYPCGNASSVGLSTSNISNNRFARCAGYASETQGSNGTWLCPGGADSHGYFPRSGAFGTASWYFTGPNQVWAGNYWDDSPAQTFCPDRSNGCGGTYSPPPSTPAPTVALSANPSKVNSGNSSTIIWSSTNASSCTASGAWSGTKNTAGSLSTGALTNTKTFNLTCSGSGGNASATTTVTVTVTATSPSITASGGSSGSTTGKVSTGNIGSITSKNASPSPPVSGLLRLTTVTGAQTATVRVDGKPTTAANTINTTKLADGRHVVEVQTTKPNGQVVTNSQVITVNNHQPFWRNIMLKYGLTRMISAYILASLLAYGSYYFLLRHSHNRLFVHHTSEGNLPINNTAMQHLNTPTPGVVIQPKQQHDNNKPDS